MTRPAKNEQTIRPSGLIRIEMHPVIDDGALYYKTLIFDLEPDSKGELRPTVRDIFHTETNRLARRHKETVVQRGKDSAARPRTEIALHRRVGWKVLGQLPPLATGGRNVEDRIHHRSQVCCARTPES